MNIFSIPNPPKNFFRTPPSESELKEFVDYEFKFGGTVSLGRMAVRYPETRERLVAACLQRKRPDIAVQILQEAYVELIGPPQVGSFDRDLQKLEVGAELLFTDLTGKQLQLRKASTFDLLYQVHCDLPQVKVRDQQDIVYTHSCIVFAGEKPFDPQMMINTVATLFVLEGNRFLSEAAKMPRPDILASLKNKLGPKGCCDFAEEIILLEEMQQRIQLMKVLTPSHDSKSFAKRLYDKFFPAPAPILKEPSSRKKND